MGQVRDLIGAQGAAAAGVLGPAEHPGLEEGAIDDQLTAALEQVEQANLALGSVELVLLVHSQPRHPPAFGGQRVTEGVKAFSFTRSCWRAASHSCCDTIGGAFIARCPFPCSLSLSLLVAISFLLRRMLAFRCVLDKTECMAVMYKY
jgi:hypothetical protein